MPSIIDSTVVASAYTTSASARPQRLSNGWIVSMVVNGITDIQFFVSKDNGLTDTKLTFVTTGLTVTGFSMVSSGTRIFANWVLASASVSHTVNFDATTAISTVTPSNNITNDTGQTDFSGCSLAIDSTGTYLHACWSSTNATLPNSKNIRYAMGTIATDGSVTWGTAQQITSNNTTGYDAKNPCIIVKSDGNPSLFYDYIQSTSGFIYSWQYNGTTWIIHTVYNGGTYAQSSPSAIFVPQSTNGLANGRIWVAWMGSNATNNCNNICVSYSDDSGVTWSAIVFLTLGNTYNQYYPTITANKLNEIFILWSGCTIANSNADMRIKQIKNTNGTWGSVSDIKTFESHLPSTIYDSTFNFTLPLFIYQATTGAKVGFYGTWTVTTISVTQGSIGTKSDKTNLLSYSITTDGTMSTITESVNGVVTNTQNATSGQSLIAGLTQAQWDAIKYGKYSNATMGLNTLTVNMGTDTFTYTFDKRLATTDDITHAMKAVADTQSTYLPSVKAKLGSAIRAKGGSVNDTDSWDTITNNVGYGSNIKSIQRGEFTYIDSSTSQNLTISSVDLTKAIVRITNYSLYGTGNDDDYTAVLTNNNTITFGRQWASLGQNMSIQWEVIEFYNVKTLQSGSFLLNSSSAQNVTISAININKSLLFVTFSSGSSSAYVEKIKATLTSNTNIKLENPYASSYNITVCWQVIEFN